MIHLFGSIVALVVAFVVVVVVIFVLSFQRQFGPYISLLQPQNQNFTMLFDTILLFFHLKAFYRILRPLSR